MKMHIFKLLSIFLGLLPLTNSRPSQVMDGNNREISDADYESSDDSAADEYLHEDEATDEIPQNRNDVPEDQEIDQNSKLLSGSGRYRSHNRDGYETMSEKTRPERDRRREKISDLHTEDGKIYPSEKEHLKADLDTEEADAEKSLSSSNNYNENHQLGDSNIKEKSLSSDYVGEPIFKTKQDEGNVDRSDSEYTNVAQETGEQAIAMKQYQNSFDVGTRGIRGRKIEYYFSNNRGRRQAPNSDATVVNCAPSEKQDVNLKSENSESSIIKNIKKLSERDLEELLNSLPEDKKAILKKIMEKREITKKAGAVEENFLEGGQSETSKVEGYLADSSTDSETSVSTNTDTTEIDKRTESIDIDNTKNSESENGSGKSESKSQFYNAKEENSNGIETGNSNNDIKSDANVNLNVESIKSDNKREINKIDYVNTESIISEKNNEDVDLEDSNDSSKDHDVLCFENEDWLDQKDDELKTYSDTQKREITANNPSDLENSVKSLEESFPNDSNGETAMSPLIRVKRTEKDHCNKKRDTNILSNLKVPFFPGVESEGTENDERSEIEDYGFFDRSSNYARSDQNNKEDKNNYETSGINGKDLKVDQIKSSRKEVINAEAGKTCLGSDTDSVLSGVEGVDDNLMYNSGIRNRRTEEVSAMENNDGPQLSRVERTARPVDLVNSVSENSINIPHYREEETFGPFSRNYEEDNGRFKRIRETKEAPISQDYSIKK